MTPQYSCAPRVAIIGSGPIGLEAAALLSRLAFAVTVFERGRCAENIRRWGHVRLFSPWEMNTSTWGRDLVSQSPPSATAGPPANSQAILTGAEFVASYFDPLQRTLAGRIRLHEHTQVVSVGRTHFAKGDAIGKPSRAEDGFRLLVKDSQGERTEPADVVLDCSGTYGHPRWIGSGGMPCPGEREFLSPEDYLLPDILDADWHRFADRTTLVVGAGYSAATTIAALGELVKRYPQTRAVWVTRKNTETPLIEIEDDSLPERAQLVRAANQFAAMPDGPIRWMPGCSVNALRGGSSPAEKIEVALAGGRSDVPQTLLVDRVVANVGYRPERTMTEELQIHECYASQGPIKLAAALIGETSTDCLQQSWQGIDLLRNPEPRFFVLGAKSYGRDSRFLMNIGIQQVAAVGRFLCEDFRLPMDDKLLTTESHSRIK